MGGRRILGAIALLASGLAFAATTATAEAGHGDGVTFVDPDGEVSQPTRLTEGPDGWVWFTSTGNDRIGRIDPSADDPATTIETFEAGADQPFGITTGPDGNLWFTSATAVGRITPAGVVTTFPDAGIEGGHDIVAGPDGTLWFTATDSNAVGEVTTAGVVTMYPDDDLDGPTGIAWGLIPEAPFGDLADILYVANTGADGIAHQVGAGDFENAPTPDLDAPTEILTDGTDHVVTGAGNDTLLQCTYPHGCEPVDADVDGLGPIARTRAIGGAVASWQASLQDHTLVARRDGVADPTTFTPDGADTITDLLATSDGDLWFTSRGNDRLGRLDLDHEAPAVVVTGVEDGGQYLRTALPTVGLTCTDVVGGSGVAECAADVDDGVQLPDTGPGPATLHAAAVDAWGNVTRVEVDYTILPTTSCNGLPATAELAFGDDPIGGEEPNVVVGTAGDDTLALDGNQYVLCLLGGDDVVTTGGTNLPAAFLGEGDDQLTGLWGGLARGGAGADRIITTADVHVMLFGDRGDDVLWGGGSFDELDGGAGADRVHGGGGGDILRGRPGDDRLDGGGGNDHLLGADGDDQLFGSQLGDRLEGGNGNDALSGGPGGDVCLGGPGRRDVAQGCELKGGIP